MTTSGSLVKVNPGLIAVLSKGGLDLDVFCREITVLECLISGTSFCKLDKVEPLLEPATKLEIKREAKNKHDGFAISLWSDKIKVGYIPREKNEVIARLMDAGKQFTALVKDKEWQGSWLKVEIKVIIKL